MLSIGVNPILWSNDDLPRLGGQISLQTCLAEASAAGYAGIELGHKFPRTAAELGPLLAEHRLRLISGWHSTRLLERSVGAEWSALLPHLELLEALGSKVVILAETTGSVHSIEDAGLATRLTLEPDAISRLGNELDLLTLRLQERGFAAAYHHHMGTVIETEVELVRLMEATRHLGLLLDTGHATFAGADPGALARRYGSRIKHVHLKDVRPQVRAAILAAGGSFLQAVEAGVFTVPGDGGVDFLPVLRALGDFGYHGWLVVEAEQDPQKATPALYAQRGFEFVAKMVAEAGL